MRCFIAIVYLSELAELTVRRSTCIYLSEGLTKLCGDLMNLETLFDLQTYLQLTDTI